MGVEWWGLCGVLDFVNSLILLEFLLFDDLVVCIFVIYKVVGKVCGCG